MSFAAAAFLAGLISLAVPWWLHRRERRLEQHRTVSSLWLMRPAEEPERSRKTLRHRLLLAVRLLLLAVLVLAFAQPMIERTASPGAAPAAALPRIIVLDVSASMAADFAAARRQAHRLIDDLPVEGRAAVVRVADAVTVVQAMTRERTVLRQAVDSTEPGNGRLSFDGLMGRLGGVAGTVDGPVEVHVISDFQASAMPAQFNGLLAGATGPVVVHPVTPDPANWLVEQVTAGDDEVTVTVRGLATPERALNVVLRGGGSELGRRSVAVPAGGRATVSFPLPETGAGDAGLEVTLESDDALAVDDTAYHVVRRAEAVSMPVFPGPGADSQLDYLTTAVAAAVPRFQPAEPTAQGPVAVLVDPGALTPDRERLLQRHMDNGGAVLMTAGPATRRAGRLPLVELATEPGRLRDRDRGVVAVDRSHPLLAHFPAWQEVTVARVLAAAGEPRGNVLLALDDGTPLLVEHRLGAGRLLVLMTGLDPAWSSLVTRPAFVSFIADALSYLAEDSLPASAVAGQPLTIPAANVQIFDADGNRLLSLSDTVGRPSVPIEAPGVYTLRTPGRERLLAVNPDLRESDLTTADGALLERWQSASRALETPAATPVSNQQHTGTRTLTLAPWLLALLGLLAVLEPVAANSAAGGSGTARRGAGA